MNDTTQARTHWYRLTPGRFVLALLVVECLLWLSDRFDWLAWHKGYAVLTAVAAVGVAVLLMVVWFAVALVFRRRFQFGIGSLLLLVVVAVPFSWFAAEMKQAREQLDVCGQFSKLCKGESGSGPWIVYRGDEVWPRWLHRVFGVEFFAYIDRVDAVRVQNGLNPPRVRRQYHEITDTEFAQLVDLLPRLKHLTLSECSVTDAGLAYLKGFHHLKTLSLYRHQTITDAGLEHVKALDDLCELNLGGTLVTDVGLQNLQGMVHLEKLDLRCSLVTNAGLANLEGLAHLQYLDLAGTKVTDAGLVHLQRLSQLHYLRVDRSFTKVTDEGVAKLQQALPNCTITH